MAARGFAGGKSGPRLRVKVPEPPPHLAALLKDRKFRWPDGSLRPEKPPYPRHVFEERRKWEDLVRYCRTTGGCPECTAGECFRCGTGVSREEHRDQGHNTRTLVKATFASAPTEDLDVVCCGPGL